MPNNLLCKLYEEARNPATWAKGKSAVNLRGFNTGQEHTLRAIASYLQEKKENDSKNYSISKFYGELIDVIKKWYPHQNFLDLKPWDDSKTEKTSKR